MVARAKSNKHVEFVSVEVDHIDQQYSGVLKVPGVDIILLDNMTTAELELAVRMRNDTGSDKPLLEASGGITLETIRGVALTGVDRISIGAITHSATAVDIGLDRL